MTLLRTESLSDAAADMIVLPHFDLYTTIFVKLLK